MSLKKLIIFLIVPVFFQFTAVIQLASAETYIGLGVGASLGGEYSDISADGDTKATDLDSEESVAYGFKVGHYFESTPWLGIELNVSQRDPDIGRQDAKCTGTSGICSGGAVGSADLNAEHMTTIGILAMFRATDEQAKNMFNFQPYLGLGLGINAINLSEGRTFDVGGAFNDAVNLDSVVTVGFLLSAGLNYKITDSIKAYSEYKYVESSFGMTTEDVKYEFDLNDHSLLFGLAYGF